MIAVDTNILIYAHRRDSPWHDRAAPAVQRLAEGPESWAIPWHCLAEFLTIVTHPRIHSPPTNLEAALRQVEAWLESPSLVLLSETSAFYQTLATVLRGAGVVGPRIHDARIAALCLHHGVTTLYSADRDFSRFGGLHTENPLVASS